MKSVLVLWVFVFQIGVLTYGNFGFAGTWRDDFEDGREPEWAIYNLDRRVEKWWVDEGEAVGQIFEPGFMSLWLTGDMDWNNYSLSCRVKLVQEKHLPASVGLTLYDRGELDERYLFFINFTLGTTRIVKATPQIWFIRNFPFVGEKETWYELKASVNGDLLEFRIDDEVFAARDLQPLKSGQAGLVVSGAQARFDHVEITGEDIKEGGPGRPRTVDLNDKLAATWGRVKSAR